MTGSEGTTQPDRIDKHAADEVVLATARRALEAQSGDGRAHLEPATDPQPADSEPAELAPAELAPAELAPAEESPPPGSSVEPSQRSRRRASRGLRRAWTAALTRALAAMAVLALAAIVGLLLAQTAGAVHLPLLGHYGVAPD